MLELDNKVAIVTGGGGIIGRCVCHALAQRGAAVAVVDVDQNAATETSREISAAGGRAIGIGCDVSDPASVAAMVDQVVAKLGSVEILHNNAATKAPISDRSCNRSSLILSVPGARSCRSISTGCF